MRTSAVEGVACHSAELDGPGLHVITVIEHFSGKFIREVVANEYNWEHKDLFKPQTKFQVVQWKHQGDELVVWLREIP